MSSLNALFARLGILTCLIAISAAAAAPRPAKNARDFAGYYRMQAAADAGAAVRVNVSLRVFNYTDGQISGASLRLEDSLQPSRVLGSFRQIVIPPRASALLKGEFTIPRREYERWRQRGAPRAVIEFKAATGERVQRPVELSPMFGGEVR